MLLSAKHVPLPDSVRANVSALLEKHDALGAGVYYFPDGLPLGEIWEWPGGGVLRLVAAEGNVAMFRLEGQPLPSTPSDCPIWDNKAVS